MRNGDDLETLFNQCLERLAQGESLESCLQRYPAQAVDLRDLLVTAQTLSAMATAPPPPRTLMTAGKQQFLRAATIANGAPAATAAARQPAPPRTRFLWGWLLSPRPPGRPAVVGITLLTVIALFLALTTLSISALPGDLFYPPKVAAETIDLKVKQALNQNQNQRDALQEAFDLRRADDVRKAIETGRTAPVTVNGVILYADPYTLYLHTGLRVALRPELSAAYAGQLRQGTHLTVIGHISPDSPLVQADQIVITEPARGVNIEPPTRPTATATRPPTRRPVVVPPTRRPVTRPTRVPLPKVTPKPIPTVVVTWTPTATGQATTSASATPVDLTPTGTATAGDLTPTATATIPTPTPDEVTATASPTVQEPTPTPTGFVTDTPTPVLEPPTATPEPSTATPEPPTATPEPPTATPESPTATPEPPTATPEPLPTATPEPLPTNVPIGQLVSALTTQSGPGTSLPGAGPAVVCCGWCRPDPGYAQGPAWHLIAPIAYLPGRVIPQPGAQR